MDSFDGDCVCGCMNDPDFASPPDNLPDRLAIARDDLRRESLRTEMAFRERDEWKENYEAMQRVAKRQSARADAAEDALRALFTEGAGHELVASVREMLEEALTRRSGFIGHTRIERWLADASSEDATRPTGDKE